MKKVLVAAVAVTLVLAGIIFLLPLAFGSDSLRTLLARQISSASGAEISLAGPVRFSVFPDFGIVARDVAYVSGDRAVSANAGKVVASVRMMSLLSDRIQITGIELDKPRIVLAQGGDNGPVEAPQAADDGDIFQLAAGYLEKLAIDRVRIREGEVLEDRGNGAHPVATDIDLSLSVPGIEKPASLSFSGTVDGMAMKLEGEIGSLRDLLNRQPAEFSLSGEMQPPPHPALASMSATGRIQLADDGSYRIANGEVTSVGQPMRLDAAYMPGDRDHVTVSIRAGVLDYADFEPVAETGTAGTGGESGGSAADLSVLRDFDVDFELQAEAVQAGDAVARGIELQATLVNGELDATVISQQIAGGTLKTGFRANFNDATPAIRGYLNLSGIDIVSLMTLAGQQVPVTGRLGTDLQYAFYGVDEATIRRSVNMKGLVSVADGAATVPELAEAIGPGADRITALNVRAEVTDITKPLDLSGTMNWNGETVGFSTAIALTDLLSGEPGPMTVELRSKPVDATFSGTVDLDGSANGKASVETASLSNLLRWVNNDPGTPLGRFSFSGAIAASSDRLALDDARITLDDMTATGNASVAMAGKTAITASLSVDALDFAKLTGGEGGGNAASGSASTAPSSAPIDLSALREFNADIRLRADRFGYGDVKAGPATATLTVQDGVARLSIPEAGLYEGSATVEVVADGTGTPAVDLAARLANVSAMPFLVDAAGFTRLEGQLEANLVLKGAGDTTDALARSLDGEARVVFSDGAIRGVDVAKLFNNVQSLISSGSFQQNSEDKTEFTELSVSYAIENGVAKTDDLKLLGPLVRMDGSGSVDLADQSIDMRLNPRVVGSLDGQGGEFDVAGLGVPIIVNGPLSQPKVYPDISNILANPGQALKTLSGLGGVVGSLAGGASDKTGAITELLGNGKGVTTDDVVTGVIQQLGSNSGDTTDGATNDTGDLVGSLLQGVLKRNGNSGRLDRSNRQAALPSGNEQSGTTSFQEQAPDAASSGSEQDSALVPPIEIVPIPTPNPLRVASTAAQPAQPQRQESVTDQLIDSVLPESPGGNGDEPKDMIRNLLKQMDN